MSVIKKHIQTTISAILVAMAFMSAGAIESEAKKFDRGYLNPGRSAKIWQHSPASIGSVNGGIWKTTTLRGEAWRDGNVNVVAGSNGRNIIGNRTNRRGFVNGVYRDALDRKSFILPYIEQDNIYR